MGKKEWKNLIFLISNFAKGSGVMTLCLFIVSIVEAVKPFIAVILTGILVDSVYDGEPFEVMLRYAVYGIAFAGACDLIGAFGYKTFNRKLESMYEAQNRPLNAKCLDMDYEYLEYPDIHKMRRNILNYGGNFGLIGATYSILYRFLSNAISVVIALVVALPMFIGGSIREYGFIGSWYMSLLMMAFIVTILWLDYKYSIFMNGKKKEKRDAKSVVINKQTHYLNLLSESEQQKDIRIFGEQQLVLHEMENLKEQEKETVKQHAKLQRRHVCAAQLVSAISGLSVYLLTGLRAYAGIISIGNVVTYTASILKLTTALSETIKRIGFLQENALCAEDFRNFMALDRKKYEGSLPVEKRQDNRFSVEFEHVSFRYPNSENYVIRDLNLSFVIGEKMAIVGKNGSGKTTFIKLLCRLYDATEGSIRLNGIDIKNYNYKEYCDLFAVVFQDFRIFAFPLGENIAASAQADKARVREALAKAGLSERLEQLPEGLETFVGKEYDESGVNFSGGEKQKMAIARAIYKDAPFVIMDEPTAALDPVSECEVFAGFDRMVGDKTALYISHRLASCRFCEDILVFDEGKVVQRGSHEQLIGQDGLYRRLWEAQAQYYV